MRRGGGGYFHPDQGGKGIFTQVKEGGASSPRPMVRMTTKIEPGWGVICAHTVLAEGRLVCARGRRCAIF